MLHDFFQTLFGTWGTVRYWAIGIGIFTVLEFLLPAQKNQPLADKLSSFGYSLVYIVTLPFVIYLPTHFISEPLFRALGHPLVTLDLDTLVGGGRRGWLLKNLVLPFVPLLVFDFFYYWTHRLQHTFPALWAQHKLHHTEYSLCAATNLRHHWLEEGLRVFTVWIPLGILAKVTGGGGSFLVPAIAYWSFFIHANIRLPLGPLTRVISGPQVHRIHHSASPEHFDRNFAAFFPLWDMVFGTYCHPKKAEWPATGMPDGERVRSFAHGLLMPFEGLLRVVRLRRKAT